MHARITHALNEQRKQPVVPRLKNESCYWLYRGINYLTQAIEQETNDTTTNAAKTFTHTLKCLERAVNLFPPGITFPIQDRLRLLSLRTIGTPNYTNTINPSLKTSLRSIRGETMHIAGTITEYIENDHFKVTARQHP